MRTIKGREYTDTRINEDGERVYTLEDGDEYTEEEIDEINREEVYWKEWADDLDRQDEDPNF